jgi:hypothetical protein
MRRVVQEELLEHSCIFINLQDNSQDSYLHQHRCKNLKSRIHTLTSKVFHSPTDAILLILENSKIYIKTCIKIAPACFGLRPSSGSLHLSLAKVTLMLKQSVKLRRYVLCGDVAAYVLVWCVCCMLCRVRLHSVSLCTAYSTHTRTTHAPIFIQNNYAV